MKTYGQYYEFEDSSARILNWVCMAIGKIQWREALCMLHIEDGQAIATDGSRLHMAKLPLVEVKEKDPDSGKMIVISNGPILPDGDYHIVKANSKIVQLARIEQQKAPFPTWRKVVPDDAPTSTKNWSSQDIKKLEKFTVSYAEYLNFAGRKHTCNLQFLSDLSFGSYSWTIEIRDTETRHPRMVVFTSGDMKAVIMPMYMEDDI